MAGSHLPTNGPIWTGDPTQPWAQVILVRGQDLVHVGTQNIHDVPVVLTMMDGRITHDAR